MKLTYVDIHIHTSQDPDNLVTNYDVDELVKNVRKIAGEYPVLLSLTDHNTINKSAYLKLLEKDVSVVLGVELHIKKYEDAPPYHCHIIFNMDINEENIDELNEKLDKLYPNKEVSGADKETPNIETIINIFDSYEFLLLPHGGQSHKTFDKATSKKLGLIRRWSVVFIIIILMDSLPGVFQELKRPKNILKDWVLVNLLI